MSEQEDPQKGQDSSGETPPSDNGAEAGGSVNQSSEVSALPSWAQDEIRSLRDEAARRRTQLREVEEKLTKTVSVEEYALVKHELMRQRIASAAGLPDDLASRLTGTTEEELRADAESLKKFVVARPGGTPPPINPATPPPSPGGDDSSALEDAFLSNIRDRAHARRFRI